MCSGPIFNAYVRPRLDGAHLQWHLAGRELLLARYPQPQAARRMSCLALKFSTAIVANE